MKEKRLTKCVSVILAVVMLISAAGCINAFAAGEKYPPLETQDMCDTRLFDSYRFTVAGRDCEPGGLDDIPMLKAEAKPIDLEIADQIIADWGYSGTDYEYTAKDVTYYGTLSDGSMLVKVNELFYFTALNYMVIGKYVYVTPNIGDEVRIYKDRKFERIITAYQDGDLSDELLDEIAQTLHFAEFVKPESSDEPSTPDEPVTEPAAEPSTPDEPVTQPPVEETTEKGETEPEFEPGSVIVSLNSGSESLVYSLLADFEIESVRLITPGSTTQNVYLVKFTEKTEQVVWDAIAVLNESSYVKTAEPDYYMYPAVEPEQPVNPGENSPVMGDVDGDGGLSIKDAAYIQLYLAKLMTLDDKQVSAADADGDGKLSIKDAAFIQLSLAGLL